MPRPKTVYIVRHGQSVDNAQPIFQAYDSPLSARGKAQAATLAARAKHLAFEALITSPQTRAQQTAQAISDATGCQLETSDLFIERAKPASILGKSYDDPAARATWRDWERSLTAPGLKVEDGENFTDMVNRADAALQFLETHDASTLLVVSHGHFIRTLIARVLLGETLNGELLKRFYELTSLENTGISVLRFKDAYEEDFRWRLWTLNDHAHFAE
jgi:broad specificity phosphatase PhoE